MKYIIPVAWYTSDDNAVVPDALVVTANGPLEALDKAKEILNNHGLSYPDTTPEDLPSIWHFMDETNSDEEGWILGNPIPLRAHIKEFFPIPYIEIKYDNGTPKPNGLKFEYS
jgi:hypothetical protein